jgi:hypothetical protein
MTEAEVLAIMEEQAQAALDSGCDAPELSLSVDVAQLERLEAWGEDVRPQRRLIEQLEPLPEYCRVTVLGPRTGLKYEKTVGRREWDCLKGKLLAVELGKAQAGLGAVYDGHSGYYNGLIIEQSDGSSDDGGLDI